MNDDSNIRKWLEKAEKFYGEQILAIVVGPHYNRSTNDKPQEDENIVLSREDGLHKLDQNFYSGYGGADCFPMFAWTKSRVFFIHEYDGSTGLSYVPRDPIPIEPQFTGNDMTMDALTRKNK